jgi:energy-coupling factor transporter transmembrane protein EcfT
MRAPFFSHLIRDDSRAFISELKTSSDLKVTFFSATQFLTVVQIVGFSSVIAKLCGRAQLKRCQPFVRCTGLFLLINWYKYGFNISSPKGTTLLSISHGVVTLLVEFVIGAGVTCDMGRCL